MAKTGRKPLYDDWLTPDGLLKIKGWIREGREEQDIAKNEIGISKETFCRWKSQFPQLGQTIKEAKRPVEVEIEDTFFSEKLKSHFVEEETTEVTIHRDADNNIISTTEHKKKTKRFIPADTTSLIFWYKVKKGWRENDNALLKEEIEDDPLTQSLKEFAEQLEGGESNADK